MDGLTFLATVAGSASLGTVVTVLVNGLKERHRAKTKTISIDESVRLSRYKWMDAYWQLRYLLSQNGIPLPDPPQDPYDDVLRGVVSSESSE